MGLATNVMGWAGPDRQIRECLGPDRVRLIGKVMGRTGSGRDFFFNMMACAGPGRGPSLEKLMSRADPPAQAHDKPSY